MGWFKKKSPLPRTSKRYQFQQPCRDLDAVVFVHGFKGHYLQTWDKFPELLDGDPDLPALDILMWGYSTGFGLFHPAVDKVGEQLITNLGLLLPHAKRIVVVAHSMGGVVTLSGLTTEMAAGRAQARPTGIVDRLVLFASPIKGEHIATAAKHLFGGLLYFSRVLNAQVRQLADGKFGRALESAVVNNLYLAKVDGTHSRAIPIHICLGRKDAVVIESAARGVIIDPRPESFEEDHNSIKLPEDRGDLRYLGLKRPLELTCAQWFRDRIAHALNSASGEQKSAAQELRRRLRAGMDARLAQAFPRFSDLAEAERQKLREEVLVLSCRIGAAAVNASIGLVLNAAIIELSELRAQ